MTHIILRLLEVITRTGLSRSSIYLRISNKEFLPPFLWVVVLLVG